MDTSPIPGFITRKQASERCKRAERTLQRYWSRAIAEKDAKVLQHLKLRGEDGRTIEGPDVTKDLIEDLKQRRQNPTWYVQADWVERTYGPRIDDAEDTALPSTKKPAERPPTPAATDNDMTTLLREQLEKKEEEVGYLRAELTIKNEQIREANERTRESNVLMRDLQKMLGDWQKQAFRSLPVGNSDENPTTDDPAAADQAIEVSQTVSRKSKKGSRRKRKIPAPENQSTPARQDNAKESSGKQTIFEKHTPTFVKALSGLFRR